MYYAPPQRSPPESASPRVARQRCTPPAGAASRRTPAGLNIKDPRKKDLQKALQVDSGYMYRIRAQMRNLELGKSSFDGDDSDVIPEEDSEDDTEYELDSD
ncbi:hypothetical protein OH76DRAFT_1488073 [Lentinus brumalis]|uniref:Uncharacterized protein n=1 Tax=Lentinus brumalis TaxID=2498619 RepID=A0A371CSB1_9APHY|nr:hypothetical protein OH76DRAFT_1488073 [Polyporus brumalis]